MIVKNSPLLPESLIVGLDYGRARVGVAVSSGEFASPKGILSLKNKPLRVFGDELLAMFAGNKIKFLVVGLSEGPMAQETRVWTDKLSKMLQLRVEFVDETLSSVLAGNKKENHARAASVILQRYLDNVK
jgi:RNase H-fold protein (predicted Holliday junction resolvase)